MMVLSIYADGQDIVGEHVADWIGPILNQSIRVKGCHFLRYVYLPGSIMCLCELKESPLDFDLFSPDNRCLVLGYHVGQDVHDLAG